MKNEVKMEIGIFNSPLIMPALASCIGVCIFLYKQYKNIGTLLILLGFVLVTATQFSINYCVGLTVLNLGVSDYPILCNSITPHVKGVDFILIAYGTAKFVQVLKQST